jgi:hypothetical protein
VSTRSAQQVLQRRLHCRFFNLQEQGFKHFVISQKLLGQSTWLSTRCAQQVGLRQLHCSSSVCKNNWANRLKGQRVLLSRLGCADYTFVSSFCRISVLNILLYLRNYWANRPECQRVVLSMLGCPDYTVVSAIFKNKCFKYFVISQKLLGQLTWGSTRSAQQVALRRLHCCFFNLQNTCFKHFVILRNYWANRPECQRVLLSRLGCADYTVVSSFCRISVLNILLYPRNNWANRPECQRVVLSRLGCPDYTVVFQFARITVLNILSYLSNYCANRPDCQRVVLSMLGCADYTVVPQFARISVLIILSYLRNYWANRPECQRVLLCRLCCPDYTVVLQFARKRF